MSLDTCTVENVRNSENLSLHVHLPFSEKIALVSSQLAGTQSAAASEPAGLSGVSTGQAVHAALPVVALYLPAAQAATLVPSPVYPASAMQFDRATDPVVVMPVFSGQAVHAALPVVALYLPAAQAAIVAPSPL